MLKWILIGLGLLIVYSLIATAGKPTGGIAKKFTQDAWMKENGITSMADYYFSSMHDLYMVRFVVDDEHKKVYVSQNTEALTEIPYTDILGCETFCNDVKSGGVGRAVAGAVIAGGVGAIVGAATAKSKVDSYYIMIYTGNIASPQIKLELITIATKTDSQEYKDAVDFSEKVTATIKAILSKTEN